MKARVTTLALASILFFYGNVAFACQNQPTVIAQNQQGMELPDTIANRVRQSVAQEINVSPEQLNIISAEQQTWSDSCFGLGGIQESCAQVLVEGWRVVLSDGKMSWAYRTNKDGSLIRLEEDRMGDQESLPAQVKLRVLDTAADFANIPSSQIELISAESRTWSDGCLELAVLDQMCTQALVDGWRVVVIAREQQLVYHTNGDGSQVILNPLESEVSRGRNLIPLAELPPPLPTNVIVRAIASGEIAGRTYEILLTQAGELTRQLKDARGVSVSEQTFQLPQEKVGEFVSFLQQQDLARYNGYQFLPPSEGGDLIMMTVTTSAGTVRYVDVYQDELPEELQVVLQRWHQLSKSV